MSEKFPSGMTEDEFIAYWTSDNATWIADALSVDDVVGDIHTTMRLLSDCKTERDAYREAGARLAKEVHQCMYIQGLTLEMCREMVDKEFEKIMRGGV